MGSDFDTAGIHKSPTSMLQWYDRYAPTATSAISGLIPGVAQQQLNAANQQMNSNNGYNALNLDQLSKYALPEAKIGQGVIDSNAQAGARTNLNQIQGAGGDAARAASALTTELNPSLSAAERGATAGINAINLNGLSPGESNAVERANNQSNTSTGNLGLNNPTNVISNAMNFGGAFNSKLGLMDKATNTANSVAGTRLGAVNPIAVALGQPSPTTGTNFGSGQFQTSTPLSAAGPASNTFGFNQATYGTLVNQAGAALGAGAQMAGQTSPASYLGSV